MLILICVGHANYGGGVISSADGTRYGGVNEYLYNKELAPPCSRVVEKSRT